METNKDKYYVVSVEDTIKYGIIKAAIIGRIRWWCQYNKDNKIKDRFHNDEWWSGFMSSKEFSEQLGMPIKTIEKHLSSLMKNNVIIKDVFNKRKYDRTGWYRVNPFPPIEDTIYSNRGNGITTIEEMDLPQLGEPIPVNLTLNQNVKQTINTSINPSVEISLEEQLEQINIQLDIIKTIDTPEVNETRGELTRQQYKIKNQLKELV